MLFPGLLDLIFPPICVHCRNNAGRGNAICDPCLEGIVINQTLFCGRCKARLPSVKRICHKDFPYTLGAACEYGSPAVKSLIHALKFRFIKDAAEPIARLVSLYI